jgi:hypothetical protein
MTDDDEISRTTKPTPLAGKEKPIIASNLDNLFTPKDADTEPK